MVTKRGVETAETETAPSADILLLRMRDRAEAQVAELKRMAEETRARQVAESRDLVVAVNADAIAMIDAMQEALRKKITREQACGSLQVASLYYPLPPEFRNVLAEAEKAAAENERPAVVIVDRQFVGGADTLKRRAFALVDVSREVFGDG